jgi:hypothetical protein
MNRILLAAIIVFASGSTLATEVGVSITVGQPGFYGRIDIGNYPQPRLIYAEPVIIEQVVVLPPPVYLRVPPGHAKHWSKHCHEYQACGQRVYFVQDSWYEDVYVPAYREKHENNSSNKKNKGKGNKKDNSNKNSNKSKGEDKDR